MDYTDITGTISAIVGGGAVIDAFFVISKKRKVESIVTSRPKNIKSYTIDNSMSNVWQEIHWFEASKLRLEYENEEQGLIVLGENMGMTKFHNGYWLMIYLSQIENGSTLVEIGIKSKVYQYPFLLHIIRDKAANRLHEALAGKSRAIH